MKRNQSGFSPVLVVLIVLVVGLIGVVGWLVHDRSKSDSAKDTPKTSTKEITSFEECAKVHPVATSYPETCTDNGKVFVKPTDSSTDETAKWVTFTPRNHEYSLRLADGWKVTKLEDGNGFYSYNSELEIKPGTPATVAEYPGGKDFSTIFMLTFGDVSDVPDGTVQPSFKTKSGVEVKKYRYVETKEPDGIGLPKGAVEYTYLVHGPTGSIKVIYSFGAGETDRFKTVERVLETISFN